ncbi:25740_t:CDS:2, partial [Racocetra persica]
DRSSASHQYLEPGREANSHQCTYGYRDDRLLEEKYHFYYWTNIENIHDHCNQAQNQAPSQKKVNDVIVSQVIDVVVPKSDRYGSTQKWYPKVIDVIRKRAERWKDLGEYKKKKWDGIQDGIQDEANNLLNGKTGYGNS